MPLLSNLSLNDSKSTIDPIMVRKSWGLDQSMGFQNRNSTHKQLLFVPNIPIKP